MKTIKTFLFSIVAFVILSIAAALSASAISSNTSAFYGIWVGATTSETEAETYAGTIRSYGFDAQVFMTTDWSNLNTTPYYVITAGTYWSESDAWNKLPSVQNYVPQAYVKYSGGYQGSASVYEPENRSSTNGYNPSEKYYVVLSSFDNKTDAENYADTVSHYAFDIVITTSMDGTWFVTAGEFDTEDEANKMLKRAIKRVDSAYVGQYAYLQVYTYSSGNTTQKAEGDLKGLVYYIVLNDGRKIPQFSFNTEDARQVNNDIVKNAGYTLHILDAYYTDIDIPFDSHAYLINDFVCISYEYGHMEGSSKSTVMFDKEGHKITLDDMLEYLGISYSDFYNYAEPIIRDEFVSVSANNQDVYRLFQESMCYSNLSESYLYFDANGKLNAQIVTRSYGLAERIISFYSADALLSVNDNKNKQSELLEKFKSMAEGTLIEGDNTYSFYAFADISADGEDELIVFYGKEYDKPTNGISYYAKVYSINDDKLIFSDEFHYKGISDTMEVDYGNIGRFKYNPKTHEIFIEPFGGCGATLAINTHTEVLGFTANGITTSEDKALYYRNSFGVGGSFFMKPTESGNTELSFEEYSNLYKNYYDNSDYRYADIFPFPNDDGNNTDASSQAELTNDWSGTYKYAFSQNFRGGSIGNPSFMYFTVELTNVGGDTYNCNWYYQNGAAGSGTGTITDGMLTISDSDYQLVLTRINSFDLQASVYDINGGYNLYDYTVYRYTPERVKWAQAYTNYTNAENLYDDRFYTLIYLDDDDIPEIIDEPSMGRNIGCGNVITYNSTNESYKIQDEHINSNFDYIEKGGYLQDSHTGMGMEYSRLYKLEDGVLKVIAELDYLIEGVAIPDSSHVNIIRINGQDTDYDSYKAYTNQYFDEYHPNISNHPEYTVLYFYSKMEFLCFLSSFI